VLRVSAGEVERNLEGVWQAVAAACAEQRRVEGAEWVPAAELCVGDVVFAGPELAGVRVERVGHGVSAGEVYDLEVEGVHSYLTEVCAVHNCGPGTAVLDVD
jgi:adenine-specific DNA-methyltransferase